MPTYQCSECGEAEVERPFDVMVVERKCHNEECREFCPFVNLDNHRVRDLIEANDIENSAEAFVAAVRSRL
jgi:hypothetical protein